MHKTHAFEVCTERRRKGATSLFTFDCYPAIVLVLKLVKTNEFEALLLRGEPLLDVRSEIEFEHSSIPGTTNIPILNTSERALVGTRYHSHGALEAKKLGYELTKDPVKAFRVEQWTRLCSEGNAVLFCARGGLRSEIAQQWLAERGFDVPRVEGGYKALRRFLRLTLETRAVENRFLAISGRTGAGKTRLLEKLKLESVPTLDLESAAVHRGSAFGGFLSSQPSQPTFENKVALSLLRIAEPKRPVLIEDESRYIGRLAVPDRLFQSLSSSPLVVLETPFEDRIRNIIFDYIVSMKGSLTLAGEHDPLLQLEHRLIQNLHRLHKRLGSERTLLLEQGIRSAINLERRGEDTGVHRCWIEPLLRDYYDPFYDRHLSLNRHRIIFRGDSHEIREWLKRRPSLFIGARRKAHHSDRFVGASVFK